MSTSLLSEAGDVALRDEALDVLTGDVSLNATDGDQVMLEGVEAICSDLKSAWQQVKGEWWLNLDEGLDWYGIVLVKKFDLGAIRQEFERVALTVPGFVRFVEFTAAVDVATRRCSVTAEVEADTGLIFTVEATLAPSGG